MSRARLRWGVAFALLLSAVSVASTPAASTEGAKPLATQEDLRQALTQAERENAAQAEARANGLASPQAQRRREASREAYADISHAEAQAILAEIFAEELEELDSDPARAITDLEVEKTLGTYAARVANEEGERALVESSIPLRAGENGGTEAVDLSLEPAGSGFVPRVPLAGVRLPDSASGSIQLRDGLEVTDLPGDGDPSAHRFGNKDLFFPESGIETDTLVSPLTAGVEIFQQLRSPESPEQFRYQLSLPDGATLRADGQGGAEVVDSAGSPLAIIPAPWAVDAQGGEIPVTMAVEGKALVLAVPHRSRDLAYPVLLDPAIIEHWESWTFGANTHALSYWSPQATAAYELSTGCIVTCWGPGLYSRSRGNDFFYGANTFGQFVYQPPGSTSYISRAIFGPNNGDVHGCFTNHPHGYVGIFNVPAGAYSSLGIYSPLSSTGNTFDTNSVGGPGTRLAVVGIGTANASSKLACGHDFYVGGATIFLDDPEAPTLGTPTGPGQPVSHDPVPITITASDPGLGVSLIKSEAVDKAGETTTWFNFRGCTGLTESPCAPDPWSGAAVIYDPSVLPEGNNTLTIRAKDAVGHESAPRTVTVTVDRTPPDTVIDTGPANNGAIGGTMASFTYHGTEANSSFECKLDSSAFASCPTTGFTTPSLADGSHTFSVRAVDRAGNRDPSAASRTFFVGPPDTVIDSGPSGLTNDKAPTFTYHATQPGTTFSCSVDGGAFASCPSDGFSTPPLADGPHTIRVRAVGSAGAADPSPALRSFTVDTTPPTVSIGSGPSGPTNSAKPTFAFAAEPGATLKCSIDTGAASFAACSNATSHTPASPLSQQTYTFRVRATDGLGNQATATRGFTVDTTSPDTSIEAGPTGLTGDPVPNFSYSSTESNASFECRLDAAGFTPCGEESFEPPEPLADGSHTFSVRAVDLAGNADPTPSSESFSVKATAPALKLESGPTGATNDPTPTFTFSASGEATLSCSTEAAPVELDEASFDACSSPESDTASPPLEDGPYTFRARAAESAENLTTVARKFNVDTEAPDTAVESGPTATTDDPRPTFGFTSNEQRSSFECRFDSSSFAPCSGPGPTQTPSTALADGAHTLQVRAIDRAGNLDATAATRSFAVNTTAPQTRFLSAPEGAVTSTSQTFKYEADQGASFECRLDEAAFAPCPANGLTTTGLSEGEHSFEVRGLNGASTSDPTPASRRFIIDTSPPATPVASGDLREPGIPGVFLHVELRDGNASSPSNLRAGMKTIRVFVDGQLIYSDEMPCIGRLGSCPDTISRDLELPYQAVLGQHVFRVEGTDAVGHPSPKAEWNEFTPEQGTILRLASKASECTKGATTAHVHVDRDAGVIRGSPEGSDLLIGRAGIDTIRGLGGCDVIIGGPGNETIEGGPDEDIIRGGRNNDHISGNGGRDVLIGGIGDDDLFGGPGPDRLDGGPGADKEVGEDGNDALRGGQGQDQLSGNGGDDTLSYADAIPPGYSTNATGVTGVLNFPEAIAGEHGVYIDLRDTRATGDNAGEGAGGGLDYLYIPAGTARPGNAGVKISGSFERIVGSPFADVIRGSGGAETVEAGPGADVVFGEGGADAIKGGANGDFLEGSADASLDGGDSAQDGCAGTANVTSCGSERAIGLRDRGKVAIGIQRPGAPGEDADVFVSGSSGGDTVAAHYDPNANTVQLTGPVSVEAVGGCTHAEGSTVTNCPLERNKDLGALVLFGGAGGDRLSVGAIADAKPAAVELDGGPDADDLGGGSLEELLVDGQNQKLAGIEILNGAGGDDGIIQGDGRDRAIGAGGDDLLVSSQICDHDEILGGGGDDNAQFHPVGVGVFADLAAGRLGQSGKSQHRCPHGGFDTLAGISDLEGSPQHDVFEGNGAANQLIGRGGRDVLIGFGGADKLNARDGHKADQNIHCGGQANDEAHVDLPEDGPALNKCKTFNQKGEPFPNIADESSEPGPSPVASSEYPLDESEGTVAANLVDEGVAGTYEAAGVGPSVNGPGPTLEAEGALRDAGEEPGVELDGSNDYIKLGDEAAPGGAEDEETEEEVETGYSIELWVKFDSPPSEREYLFSSMEAGEGTYLYRSAEGKVVFGTSSEAGAPVVSTAEPIEDEEWHQVVGTLEDETIELYVDGFPHRLGYGQSVLPEEVESAEDLIGTSPGLTHFLDGSVDEISTYEGALPESEVINQLASSKAQEVEILLAPEAETGDGDGDGVTDGIDNCAETSNADQTDADLNGIGDACEPPDGDGDGIADASDNCPEAFNPEQDDGNDDGLGDACDELPPTAITKPPSAVRATSVNLNATVNPGGTATSYRFEYGKTTTYGTSVPISPKSVGSGADDIAVSAAIGSLEPNTTYHYRIVATNAAGLTQGGDETFTTPRRPVATTEAATNIAATSAVLNARVNPEGSATSYQLEYGKTTTYGSKAPASPGPLGSGTENATIAEAISGLEPNTTYHYRVVAIGDADTVNGTDRTFTTAAPPPLAAMATTEPFNGGSTPISNFSSNWSKLGWATEKGESSNTGWRPVGTFPTVSGTSYAPTLTDTGSGVAAVATLATNPGDPERYFSLWLDMPNPVSAARAGYELRFTLSAANTYNVTLAKWQDGAKTVLASKASCTFANGNSFALVDQGAVVSAWTNTGSGFTQLLSAGDSTFSSGRTGLEGAGNVTRLTNFKAGVPQSPVAGMGAALEALQLNDAFATNESPLSGNGAWAALAWASTASGHPTGHVEDGWGPFDPSPDEINGAFWQKTNFADTGSGTGVAATLMINPGDFETPFSLWLNMPSPASARSGYALSFDEGQRRGTTFFDVALTKWEGGVDTLLAFEPEVTLSEGSQLALVQKAGTLTARGDGSLLLSAVDSTFTSGYTGIEASGGLTRLVDFRSGPLPPF